ncbi:MAG: hypothetical protein IK029_00860 [Oscillospiraceae bacterium]|nr:hypothetical protein [Oscillospiraceae bacterium]
MVYATAYHMDTDRITPRLMCDELPNCPECENLPDLKCIGSIRLKLQDNVRRHYIESGGDVTWFEIPRGLCPSCNCIMRILPDFLAPFKHYRADDMSVYLGRSEDDNLDVSAPSEWTRKNWNNWLEINHDELSPFGIDKMRADNDTSNWIGESLVQARNSGKRFRTGPERSGKKTKAKGAGS